MKTPAVRRSRAGLLAVLILAVSAAVPAAPRGAVRGDETPTPAPETLPFRCTDGVTLPLDGPEEGLTEKNVADVKRALMKMTRPRYQCPACKMKADWCATCEGCGELFEETPNGMPLFSRVEVDAASRTACLELDRSGVLTLSGLGKALAPTGVGLRRADLDIVAWTRITVRMDPNDIPQAKKALERPGFFASIGVRVDEGSPSTSFIVQHAPRKPITLARVAEALSGATPGGLVFEDLSWPAACLTCEEAGRRRGGCRACWQAEIRREANRKQLR